MFQDSQVCSVLRTSAIASPFHSACPKEKEILHIEVNQEYLSIYTYLFDLVNCLNTVQIGLFNRHKKTFSDLELLEQYQSTNDLGILGDLYQRYMEMQLGLCYKYLQDLGKAEDAVMAIFEELIEKVKGQKIEKFDKWLYVLSKNHCLMQLRKENKKSLTVIYDSDLMHNQGEKHPEDDWLAEDFDDEMLQKLELCIKDLPEKQADCIRKHYFDKKSYKEIAELTSEEPKKIRSYIQNGRRNLKNCLERKR